MTLSLAALVMAAWGLLQRGPSARAGLLIGALTLGLAAATLALQLGSARPALLASAVGNATMWAVLHGVAALVLLAVVTAIILAPSLPTVAVTGLTVWIAWPLTTLPRPLYTAGTAAAIAAAGLLGGAVTIRVRPGRIFLALDHLLDPRGYARWRLSTDWVPTAWPLVAAVGIALGFAIPHLIAALGGPLVAALAAFLAARRGGRPAWALFLAVVSLLLMLAGLRYLSGPLGGWIPVLIDGPFSPRAAQNLAFLSFVSTTALVGAWPLHGVTVPVLLAPAAIPVGATVATLLLPDGVQWWQPLAAPLALAAMGHAVATRRAAALMVAAGLFGLWTGRPVGAVGGAVLIASGWMAAVAPATWVGRLPIPPAVLRLVGLIPAAGALGVLHGGIHGEVTWLLVGVMITAVALAGWTRSVDPHQ